LPCSLGVEPVDHDVLKQPPRKAKDPIISRQLIINVIISAAIIVSGTLWVFWHEVRMLSVTQLHFFISDYCTVKQMYSQFPFLIVMYMLVPKSEAAFLMLTSLKCLINLHSFC